MLGRGEEKTLRDARGEAPYIGTPFVFDPSPSESSELIPSDLNLTPAELEGVKQHIQGCETCHDAYSELELLVLRAAALYAKDVGAGTEPTSSANPPE